jgi:hypothetical protein
MKNFYIITSVLVIFALGLFFVQVKWCDINTFWYSATGNIANAILICGIISLLEHIVTKKENDEQLAKLFHISSSIRTSGMTNILTDSSQYDYHDLITSSQFFCGILNDGRRWVGNHSDAIEQRFNKKGNTTEFYFVNPDSDFCKALATKTDVPGQDTPDKKILQTISMLKSTYERSEKNGVLKIYFLKNYPTQTLFYTDNTVVVTPYQTSSGRAVVPLYEYHYDISSVSIGAHLYKDLLRVRKESSLIFDSSK